MVGNSKDAKSYLNLTFRVVIVVIFIALLYFTVLYFKGETYKPADSGIPTAIPTSVLHYNVNPNISPPTDLIKNLDNPKMIPVYEEVLPTGQTFRIRKFFDTGTMNVCYVSEIIWSTGFVDTNSISCV